MKDGEEDHPRIGHSSPLLTLWEKPSTRFETPKAIIYLHFACPEVRQKPCDLIWGYYCINQHRSCCFGWAYGLCKRPCCACTRTYIERICGLCAAC